MRFHRFVPAMALLIVLAAPLAARETIGGYGAWASFCDEPRKCFAISRPEERRGRPYLSVAVVGRGLQVQAHIGRPVREAGLRVGHDRFELTPVGEDATADTAISRRIVRAMRTGETLTIYGSSTRGGRFRHHYALAGAPSAIDAAALASRR